MGVRIIGQAAGLFAVTNIDDLVVLAVFFGQAVDRRGVTVVAGQYVGFAAILVLSVAGALGAGLLPPRLIPYLGLVPLLLGIRAALVAWHARPDSTASTIESPMHGTENESQAAQPRVLTVAAVTLANGGDNIGVYVPVFTGTTALALLIYALVFLLLVALWCLAGRVLATRPPVARALSRWGHIVLPVALIGIGVTILVRGHAFGLS